MTSQGNPLIRPVIFCPPIWKKENSNIDFLKSKMEFCKSKMTFSESNMSITYRQLEFSNRKLTLPQSLDGLFLLQVGKK